MATTDGVAGITAGATLATALIVAVTTAVTTNARQHRQLNAEFDRQAAALAHERELADIADLRALLDEAAIAFDQAAVAQGTVARRARPLVRRDVPEERRRKLTEELTEILARHEPPLWNVTVRARVRLGERDELVRALTSGCNLLRQLQSNVAVLGIVDPDEDERALRGPTDLLYERQKRFIAVAVERVGPQQRGVQRAQAVSDATDHGGL